LDRDRRAPSSASAKPDFRRSRAIDSFDFLVSPSLNRTLVLELARCEFLSRKENLLLLGNSGAGKSHVALALGLAACQRGRVRFITAAVLVSELIEARDDRHLLRFQKQLAAYELLIVDELGYVPLSKTGAELRFETFSQPYERASTLVTSNLAFDEWTEVFGSQRLTGALLEWLTVLKAQMNADLLMAGDLKNTGKGNLFVVFGEPDIEILPAAGGPTQLKVKGVDVFEPHLGRVESSSPDELACWFIDTDYKEESFFVRHAYFLGANDLDKALKTTLKAEINEEAWETLLLLRPPTLWYSTTRLKQSRASYQLAACTLQGPGVPSGCGDGL
jgi:DNA replication protein DnaC